MTDFNISIFLVLYYRPNDTILKYYYRIDDSTLSGFFQEEGVADYDHPIWKILANQCSADFNQTIYKDAVWISSTSNREFYEKYIAAACSANGIDMNGLVRIKAKLYPWSSVCDAACSSAELATDTAASNVAANIIYCSS
jgi:hypothetical protein